MFPRRNYHIFQRLRQRTLSHLEGSGHSILILRVKPGFAGVTEIIRPISRIAGPRTKAPFSLWLSLLHRVVSDSKKYYLRIFRLIVLGLIITDNIKFKFYCIYWFFIFCFNSSKTCFLNEIMTIVSFLVYIISLKTNVHKNNKSPMITILEFLRTILLKGT